MHMYMYVCIQAQVHVHVMYMHMYMLMSCYREKKARGARHTLPAAHYCAHTRS